MMQHYADFKLVKGCSPCVFVCVCCERTCYRCSANEDMWMWFNKHTQETLSILCGHCYNGCPQGLGNRCKIQLDEIQEEGTDDEGIDDASRVII